MIFKYIKNFVHKKIQLQSKIKNEGRKTKKGDLLERRNRVTGVSKDFDGKYTFLCVLEHENEDGWFMEVWNLRPRNNIREYFDLSGFGDNSENEVENKKTKKDKEQREQSSVKSSKHYWYWSRHWYKINEEKISDNENS